MVLATKISLIYVSLHKHLTFNNFLLGEGNSCVNVWEKVLKRRSKYRLRWSNGKDVEEQEISPPREASTSEPIGERFIYVSPGIEKQMVV